MAAKSPYHAHSITAGVIRQRWRITPAVEKILIHAPEIDENGERTQEIEIYYRFIGKID